MAVPTAVKSVLKGLTPSNPNSDIILSYITYTRILALPEGSTQLVDATKWAGIGY